MTTEDDEKAGLHKANTTPPPAGEEDAYNAPTKVGKVNNEAWAALIAQTDAEPPRAPPPRPKPKSEPRVSSAPNEPMPRLYEEESDDGPTQVHPQARMAQLGPPMESAAPAAADASAQPIKTPALPSAAVPVSMSQPPAPALAPAIAPPPFQASDSNRPNGSSPPTFLQTEALPNVSSSGPNPVSLASAALPPSGVPAHMAAAPAQRDYLLVIIAVAAVLGFLTLTVGVLLALNRL